MNEYQIFDRHNASPASPDHTCLIKANSFREARKIYRESAYPNRRANPSGVRITLRRENIDKPSE